MKSSDPNFKISLPDMNSVHSRIEVDLPTRFVSDDFDSHFMSLISSCLVSILKDADAKGQRVWEMRSAALKKLGLTELNLPRFKDIGPIEVTTTGADGQPSTRVVKMKPFPDGYQRLSTAIERSTVADANRLAESCQIMAYLFCYRILPAKSQASYPALMRLNSNILADYMEKHHRGQFDAESLARFVMSRSIDEMTADLDALKGFDRLSARLVERHRAEPQVALEALKIRLDEQVREAKQALELIAS